MIERLYEPTDDTADFHSLFDQLRTKMGGENEIWIGFDDFGRNVIAGVLNRRKSIAVKLHLRKGGRNLRTSLSEAELAKILGHLSSDTNADLEI